MTTLGSIANTVEPSIMVDQDTEPAFSIPTDEESLLHDCSYKFVRYCVCL